MKPTPANQAVSALKMILLSMNKTAVLQLENVAETLVAPLLHKMSYTIIVNVRITNNVENTSF